jgi:hypothetical protein
MEARLRGVTEPSVEKLKEALREEMDKLEGGFLTRKNGDDTVPAEGWETILRRSQEGILEGPRDQWKPLMGRPEG